MPKLHLLFSIATLPVVVVACQPTAAKTETSGNGWILTQKSHMSGLGKVYISDKGVKVSLQSGVNITSVSPFRQVCIYSEKTKKMHHLPFEKFRGQFQRVVALVTGASFTEIPLLPEGATKVLGIEAQRYTSTAKYQSYQRATFKGRTISNSAAESAECTVSSAITPLPQIGTFLDRLYGLPKMNGVPLEATFVDLNKNKQIHLVTSSAIKSNVPESDLSTPAGLKEVPTSEDVTVGANDDEAMQLILDGADRKMLHP